METFCTLDLILEKIYKGTHKVYQEKHKWIMKEKNWKA
jgi:hypothetical protein